MKFLPRTLRYPTGIAKKDHEYKTNSAAIPVGITVLLDLFRIISDTATGRTPEQPMRTMINREIVANELYTTYCAAVGGVAFNGDPLPSWEDFAADESKSKQSEAWLAAADRAMDLLLS